MVDLITNINQVVLDLNAIKQAIINKGVSVPNQTPTKKYSELINNIKNSNNENPTVLVGLIYSSAAVLDEILSTDKLFEEVSA